MNKLSYIAKSINILNSVLLLTLAAASYEILLPFANLNIRTVLPAIRRTATGPIGQLKPVPVPSPTEYASVGEQNLFHPERRIPPEKKVEREAAVLPKPDLILYGTLIADNLSIAYIEDRKSPYSTPGRRGRQRQMKKGEILNGYVLREIETDRIVLVNKDKDRLIVSLYDKDKARLTEAAPATAAAGTPAPRAAAPVYSPASRSYSGAAAAPNSTGAVGGYGYRPTAAAYSSPGTTATGSTTPGATSSGATTAGPTNTGSNATAGTTTGSTTPIATTNPDSGFPSVPPDTTSTPTLNPTAAKLPPRSHALSDMLTITPNQVRRSMGGN